MNLALSKCKDANQISKNNMVLDTLLISMKVGNIKNEEINIMITRNIFIGIDVSKGHADFTFIDVDGKEVTESTKLFDNLKGHKEIIEKITSLQKSVCNTTIFVAMEITGGYETHWNNIIRNHTSANVFVISGKSIKYFHESQLSRNKTDAISSMMIARYLKENYKILNSNTKQSSPGLKECSSLLNTVSQDKAKYTNILKSQLYRHFPEFLPIAGAKFSNWCYEFLLQYPTSYHAKKGHISRMYKIPYAPHKKLDKLKQACNSSLFVLDAQEAVLFSRCIRHSVNKILEAIQTEKEFIDTLDENIDKEQVELLEGIPGVGHKSALTLLCLIGDIKRFDSPKKLAAYFGVHPVLNNSGNVVKSRMSKQGNPLSRKILFFVALNVTSEKSPFHKIYEEYVEQMTVKKKVLGRFMHMICRVLWAILYYKRPFDMQTFMKHRKRKKRVVHAVDSGFEKLHEKGYDYADAPISPRLKRKLKQEDEKRRALN